MTTRIRPAAPADIPGIAALQMADARVREGLEPQLWATAPDAPERIAAALQAVVGERGGPLRHHWLVAEMDGAIAGFVHAINLPPPPVYDTGGHTAGVLLDDSHFPAAEKISAALIEAAEAELRKAGASLLVAAAPARWHERVQLFEARGYGRTTLYMTKAALSDGGSLPAAVRRAEAGDIDAITRLSARHRAGLHEANPLFWNIHAEADSRFAKWMEISLGLADRDMFVAGPAADLAGYIIAQPCSPLHLPPAHDAARIGLIDDFHVAGFEAMLAEAGKAASAALLTAAETAMHARGQSAALAVCPAGMPAKRRALEDHGYLQANIWLVKG